MATNSSRAGPPVVHALLISTWLYNETFSRRHKGTHGERLVPKPLSLSASVRGSLVRCFVGPAACVPQTNITTRESLLYVTVRFPTTPACATHLWMEPHRGATIESSREIEASARFQPINSSERKSENAVASRLAMVRITTLGTRVPGNQLSSHRRLKPISPRSD